MPTPKPVVWVLGDVMLDVAVRRSSFRRTAENSTIPVLPAVDFNVNDCAPGGAANLACNLAAMDCKVRLFCVNGRHNDPNPAQDKLEKLCRRYRYFPLFGRGGREDGTLDVEWIAASRNLKAWHGWGTQYDEMDAVLDMAGLAQDGMLRRLKKCDYCNRWMFARFVHQRFCSGSKCREKPSVQVPQKKRSGAVGREDTTGFKSTTHLFGLTFLRWEADDQARAALL